MAADVERLSAQLNPQVVAWRRDFHQNPELGNREARTATVIADELRKLGFTVTTGVATTGVVGVLKGGLPGLVVPRSSPSCENRPEHTAKFAPRVFTPKAIEEELKVSSVWYSLGLTQGVPAGFIKMEKSKPLLPLGDEATTVELSKLYVLSRCQRQRAEQENEAAATAHLTFDQAYPARRRRRYRRPVSRKCEARSA